jgi:hypothetical protein
VIEDDPYLSNFKFTKDPELSIIEYKTILEEPLTNIDDIFKTTLVEFKSVYKDDQYLKHFMDSYKGEIDNFLM